MVNFLVGILTAALVGGGVYYFMVAQKEKIEPEPQTTQIQLQAEVEKRIPAGAIMEDGTLME